MAIARDATWGERQLMNDRVLALHFISKGRFNRGASQIFFNRVNIFEMMLYQGTAKANHWRSK